MVCYQISENMPDVIHIYFAISLGLFLDCHNLELKFFFFTFLKVYLCFFSSVLAEMFVNNMIWVLYIRYFLSL